MRTFAYLRVSTKEQLDKNGLARQSQLVQEFIASKEWTCARVFQDQKSGGSDFSERFMLIEMLELAQAFGVGAVVVERADRIARDLMTQEVFLAKCVEQKLLVYAADSGEELTLPGADPTRILLRQVVGAIAQWEKAMLVRKLQDGRRRTKLKTGAPCGGPSGYGRTGDEEQQMYEKSIMRFIVDRRKGMKTHLEIAQLLNRRKVKAPGGGDYWHGATVYRMEQRAMEEFDIFPKCPTYSVTASDSEPPAHKNETYGNNRQSVVAG